ncbi:MAG: nucleoside kinase [Treponema sp.]|nr:nucleoside kinase [Treponema sp.]
MQSYKIKITFPSGKTIEAATGSTPADFINEFDEKPEKIFAVRANNEVVSLNRGLFVDSTLEPVLMSSKDGSQVYRRTLCFILAAAAHELNPNNNVIIENSFGYAYYYSFQDGSDVPEKFVCDLKERMDAIIKKNVPIETHFISYEQAIQTFENLGLLETRKQLNYVCPPRVQMNTIGEYTDLYYGPMLVSTGALGAFKLQKYKNGFLILFPSSSKPDTVQDFKEYPVLFETYARGKKWGKQIGVTSVASLNELVSSREADEFINISEVFQEKCISDIASQIHNRGTTRLVLIAGPSSSGKTTSAKKLAMELQAIGYKPKVISLDDYYVGRDRTPKDENGNYDYECIEALDIELINQNLLDLFAGKKVELPSYNFVTGSREYKGKTLQLGPNDILIMEGIHGLNDRLTHLIQPELKFKLYLSALTQLNINEHNRISTSDNRLIRRIVRDNNFRGKSAAATIAMWDSVRRGERLHIFPFQNNADAILNTALDYELSVLKVYAEPLLRCIHPGQKEYSEACRLLRFLNAFPPIPATAVPDRSIIREFIGGSAFKY